IIEIEKLNSEAKKRNTDRAETGGGRLVGEFAVPVIVVEVVGIVGEIGFRQIRPTVIVVVSEVHAHAGLFPSICAVSNAGSDPDLSKSTLAIVVVKQAGRRIISNVNVVATVLVVIAPDYAQAVVGVGIDVVLLGYVGERAVAIVVVQPVACAFKASRTARNGKAAILAERSAAEDR